MLIELHTWRWDEGRLSLQEKIKFRLPWEVDVARMSGAKLFTTYKNLEDDLGSRDSLEL